MSLNGQGKGLRETEVPEKLYDECLSPQGSMSERVYVRRPTGSTSQMRR
jgi:hypothetical protein